MDNNSNPRTQLSKKRSRGSDEDLISKLPDSLLQHILSFVSTRDAVRTSILSRRWQNLWMLVPCFDLGAGEFSDENVFYNFMDRFLDLRGNSHSQLQKFKLNYILPKRQSSRFKLWIDVAIRCKVEHLEVRSYCDALFFNLVDDGVRTPQSLCICNTLVVLKVGGVDDFDIPKRPSLSNLKIMHLIDVKCANDIAFKSLISGCPVLEELKIHRVHDCNIKVLCISSHTLKKLIIYFASQFDNKEYGVVIDAPSLEYLELYDENSNNFRITKIVSSSLKACLCVKFGMHDWHEMEHGDFSIRKKISRLLTEICNARSLIIQLETFKLLCQYRKFEALPQFHNLIHLDAELSEDKCEMLPAVLECCPNLKFLILDLHDPSKPNPPRLSLAASHRMPSSLESITLQTPIMGSATEMKLIKYFLLRSPVLKEMKVYLINGLNQEKESHIFRELLMFPRRSEACQIRVEQDLFG